MRAPVFPLLVALTLSSCSASKSPPKAIEPAPPPSTLTVLGSAESREDEQSAPPSLGRVVAKVSPGSLGPRLFRSGPGGIVIWADKQGDSAKIHTASFSKAGAASQPKVIGSIEESARLLEVGAFKENGAAAAFVRREGNTDLLEVYLLGAEGEFLAGPYLITSARGNVLWVQVEGTRAGAVVLWAEQDGHTARIHSALVKEAGPESPRELSRGVKSWQAKSGQAGLALATAADPESGSAKPVGSTVSLRQLGDQGDVIGAPIEIARGVRGGMDLDLTMAKGRIVVAFSERRDLEAQIFYAQLDPSGNVKVPLRALTRPRGEQVLVRLVGSEDSERVDAIWEEPGFFRDAPRSFLLAEVPEDSRPAAPQFSLEKLGSNPLLPQFARKQGALLALTEADACLSPRSGCQAPTRVPVLTVTDKAGKSRSRPLMTQSGQGASMAWDLSCEHDDCLFLSADAGHPAEVLAEDPESGWLSESGPMSALSKEAVPRVVSNEALLEVPELASLCVGALPGGQWLVSYLTYFDPDQPLVTPSEPAPDGRRDPVRAHIKTLRANQVTSGVPANFGPGALLGKETVISLRARSLGGLSLVPPTQEPGLLLWAALDAKDPQLFATILGVDGQKIRQKMLTRTKGEVTDAAAVRVPGGYILAWVDGRDDAPSVLALKVDEQLRGAAAATVVSEGAAPTGLALAVMGERVLATWADTLGAPTANLHSAVLSTKDAARLSGPLRLHESQAHAHSAALSAEVSANFAHLSWIETTTMESEGSMHTRGKLMLAEVDDQGRMRMASPGVSTVRAAAVDGSVVDQSLSCQKDRCRIVAVTEGTRRGAELWGISEGPASALRAQRITTLRSQATAGITPVVAGNEVFYADKDLALESWLLRRADVLWD